MKTIVSPKPLRGMLDEALRFEKGTRRIDRRVQLDFSGGTITMTAWTLWGTNLLIISAPCCRPVEGTFKITVNPTQLREVMVSCGKKRDTFFELCGDNLVINGERSVEIFNVPPKELLALGVLWERDFDPALIPLLDRVLPAMYEDDDRPATNAVSLEAYPGGYNLVATDGHRIHWLENKESSYVRVSIPAIQVGAVKRVAALFPVNDHITILAGSLVSNDFTTVKWDCDGGGAVAVVCNAQTVYPNWRAVTPKTTLSIPLPDDFASTIRAGGLPQDFDGFRMKAFVTLLDDMAVFSAGFDPDGLTELCRVDIRNVPAIESPIAIAANLLLEYLDVAGPGVTLSPTGPRSPVIMRSPLVNATIMPMWIGA